MNALTFSRAARPALALLIALAIAAPASAQSINDRATACWNALDVLLKNNYAFGTTPDPTAVAPGAEMSFADAYAEFQKGEPHCRALLAEPAELFPASAFADEPTQRQYYGLLDANFNTHRQKVGTELKPELAFTDRMGYLDGPAGIVNQGGRTVTMCPQQHQRRFSCDLSAERVQVSAELLKEYVQTVRITALVGATATDD